MASGPSPTELAELRKNHNILAKNTIFNEHPVYVLMPRRGKNRPFQRHSVSEVEVLSVKW